MRKKPKNTEETKNTPPKEPVSLHTVVAIGASAGGLGSLEKFFTNLPPQTGMAFVIVVHLTPDRTSILPELIARYTRMKVSFAEEAATVVANNVYVIPANYDLRIINQHFSLEEKGKRRGAQQTIDVFFKSLAEDLQEHSVGIIMSGTGSDGTEGIKAIKGAGGIALAESDTSAAYPSMPQSAIATGLVDIVLPAEEMPENLTSIVTQANNDEEIHGDGSKITEEDLKVIFRAVQQRTGIDFNAYKINTILRRIYRRMVINGTRVKKDYLALLKKHPEESHALLKDVLIGVTSFFRDPKSFEELDRLVLPKLFLNRSPDNPIRIWLVGCSTGEEAYSVAILLQEYMQQRSFIQKVKIFASDLDPSAIEYARKGYYPTGIHSDISKQRLDDHFIQNKGHYEIKKHLREMIVFAQHNLTNDPPFSKLDLIVCRNVLIYLKADIQKKILPLFHQALKPSGFLFLGTAETVGTASDLFATLSGKWKIYQRKENSQRIALDFPKIHPASEKHQQQDETSTMMKYIKPGQIIEKLLIERYTPPSMLINEKNEVLYYSSRTDRYLEMPIGEPTQNILKLAKEEIRPALRAAIHKAQKENEKVTYSNISVTIDGQSEQLSIHVEPLKTPATLKGFFIVILEQLIHQPDPKQPVTDTESLKNKDQIISQLDEQLRITHDELQETIGRLETSNEELKSSNEELMSMNEEFQSTNEELETSKEELQALNEELITVNSELETKVEELGQANNDIENLLNSSEIATLFLDRDLNVKRYTPSCTRLYNIIPADIDRPFEHVSGKVNDPQLVEDAKSVLKSLQPIEREIITKDQQYYLVRSLPYRTLANTIDGVVLTFTDITSRHKAETYRARLAAIVEASADAIIGQTLDGVISSWNHGAEKLYGYTAEEIIGQSVNRIIPPDRNSEVGTILEKISNGERVARIETERMGKDQRIVQISLSYTPIFNEKGQVVATASIAHDITQEKQQQQQLMTSEELHRKRAEELSVLMDAVPAAVFIAKDAQSKTIETNKAGHELLRINRHDEINKTIFSNNDTRGFKVFHDGKQLKRPDLPLQKVAVTGEALFNFEEELVFEDGARVSLLGNSIPLKSVSGEPRGAMAVFLDITNRVQMERELVKNREILRLFIEHAPVALAMFDTQMNYLAVSHRWRNDYGLGDTPLIGQSHYKMIPETPQEWRLAHEKGMQGEDLKSEGDRFERKDGTVQWIRWGIHPWRTRSDEVSGIIIFSEDITAIKLSQEAQFRNEKELSAIFNQAAVGMAKVGKNGGWLRVNKRLCDIVGYTPKELETLTFQDITYSKDLVSDLENVRRMLNGEIDTYSMEKRYIHKDKSIVWINLTVSAVRNEDKQVEFFISIIEDINRRKKAEQRHSELESEIRQKYKMEAIGIMSGGIAHNFNNSLSVILGNIELAKLKLSDQTTAIECLDNAKLAIMRTRGLIEQVMLYSHKKGGAKTIINLNQVLEESMTFLRAIMPTSIALNYQTFDKSQDLMINASASGIQEVLLNLAGNASHAMDEEGKLKISLETVTVSQDEIPVQFNDFCHPGNFARLSVKDSGCGIPKTIIDQIFDPFFTTKEVNEGTGIGLSTVMGFIKNSGGMVKVTSESGQGTLFELYFPLIKQKPLIYKTDSEVIAKGSERILIVDDDEKLADVSRQILSSLGYQVETLTSSLAAFELLEENSEEFDLLIVDQTMPELTGVELFKRIKAKEIHIPTILCTGYSTKVSEKRAKEMGIDAYCTKPLDMTQLAKIIRSVLDQEA